MRYFSVLIFTKMFDSRCSMKYSYLFLQYKPKVHHPMFEVVFWAELFKAGLR